MSLRPSNVDATLQEEPSMQERERIFRLLHSFGSIYPVRVALTEMLNFPNLTLEEERYLAFLETGKLEEMIDQRKSEFGIVARNGKTGDFRAA
jgi:hypothetical protein